MKRKISVTMDEDDTELFERAVRITRRLKDSEVEPGDRKWVLLWAMRAVCAAIVQQGSMPCPLGVDLRSEYESETRARLKSNSLKGAKPPAYRLAMNISREELAALHWFVDRHFGGEKSGSTIGSAAGVVLRAAMGHPEELSGWIGAMTKYRHEEGFEETVEADRAIGCSFIAGRREYRKQLRAMKE